MSTRRRSAAAFFMILFIVAGIAAMCGSALFARRSIELRWYGQRAQGTVVDMEARRGKHTTHAPIFRYNDDRGVEHTVTSRIASRPPAYRKGDIATILYDPDDPTVAEIDSFVQLWLIPSIFALIGLVIAGIGTVALVAERLKSTTGGEGG